MAQIYKDPYSYLNDAVVKRGKSGSYGVYLQNVVVVAEATSDYGYKVFLPAPTAESPFQGEEETPFEWYQTLVRLRSQVVQTTESIYVDRKLYQFCPEGGTISMNVFIPEAFVDTFNHEVVHSQRLLNLIGDFTGKTPTTVRFTIGVAYKSWYDMAEEGEVQEIEYAY